ncbi:MAG: hypothetical protein WA782_03100 [Sulfitobacter sp.]
MQKEHGTVVGRSKKAFSSRVADVCPVRNGVARKVTLEAGAIRISEVFASAQGHAVILWDSRFVTA